MKIQPLSKVIASVDAISEIDRRIKPLVIGLQRFGIRTDMSCEGHTHALPYPWIEVFKEDLELLYKLVQIYNRPVPKRKRNKRGWVIQPFCIPTVRLIPMYLDRPLYVLKREAERFGYFLQNLSLEPQDLE